MVAPSLSTSTAKPLRDETGRIRAFVVSHPNSAESVAVIDESWAALGTILIEPQPEGQPRVTVSLTTSSGFPTYSVARDGQTGEVLAFSAAGEFVILSPGKPETSDPNLN